LRWHLLGGAWILHPIGGGKWIIEAPYVMQAANDLKVHLGWAVASLQHSRSVTESNQSVLMLPLLGVLGLKARDIVGFTFLQLVVHFPVVLFCCGYWPEPLPTCRRSSRNSGDG